MPALSPAPIYLANFWSTLRLSKQLQPPPQSILQAPRQTQPASCPVLILTALKSSYLHTYMQHCS